MFTIPWKDDLFSTPGPGRERVSTWYLAPRVSIGEVHCFRDKHWSLQPPKDRFIVVGRIFLV